MQSQLRRVAEKVEHYTFTPFGPRTCSYVLTDGHRSVEIDAGPQHAYTRGYFDYPVTVDLLHREWLLPGTKSDDPSETREVQGVTVFSTQYFAIQWWRGAINTAFYYHHTRNQNTTFAKGQTEAYHKRMMEIQTWVDRIEAGEYPKHPGDHCKLCPARGQCLGLPEVVA